MDPGATRTSSVLHVGAEEELVRSAVADAFDAATFTTVDEADTAIDRLTEGSFDAVVVGTGVEEWSALVTDTVERAVAVPTLVVVEEGGTENEALDAGAADVFDRETGGVALLARRLANVVSAGAAWSERGRVDGPPVATESEFTDLLLDTIDDVFYLVGPGGEMRRWNDTLASVTGYSDDEIAAMEGLEFFAADHHDRVASAIETALDEGSATVEADMLTADGERIPFDITGARLTDAEGRLRGIVGVGRDVSRRRERQRELELVETVFEEAQDSIFVVDVVDDGEFRIERVNPAYAEATGIDTSAVEGARPADIVGADQAAAVGEHYRECVETAAPIEYEERLEIDGETCDWHTKLAPVVEDGDVVKLVGATRDITERRDLERELREQANLLDHIFNQVPSALYVKDEEARFVRKRNYDHDPDDYVGKTDVEFFGDSEYTRETYADDLRVIEEGERIINKEEYNPLSDEWVLTSKVPWRDADGEIQGLIGVSRLITEKKEFERDLRLRNRAMEEAPIGICLFDLDEDSRRIRYANSGFETLTGYDGSSLEGGDFSLLTGPETDEGAMATLAAAFTDGEAVSTVSLFYRNDRNPFWGRVSIAPVTDDDGTVTHFVGFLQDVTDEKEHEQRIERRLDEFGDLLAQQLRPPLDSARETLRADGVDDETVEQAARSIDRADRLVEDLATVNTFSVKSREVSESLSDGDTDDD